MHACFDRSLHSVNTGAFFFRLSPICREIYAHKWKTVIVQYQSKKNIQQFKTKGGTYFQRRFYVMSTQTTLLLAFKVVIAQADNWDSRSYMDLRWSSSSWYVVLRCDICAHSIRIFCSSFIDSRVSFFSSMELTDVFDEHKHLLIAACVRLSLLP